LDRRAEKQVTLATGSKLGPYEIQSPLGAGGMGEVYGARDTRLDRDVAIKVLPANLSSDPISVSVWNAKPRLYPNFLTRTSAHFTTSATKTEWIF
jgi:serine/threonine protein kinase